MVSIEKLTLREMMMDVNYHSLSEGLVKLPIPDKIKIGKKYFNVPDTMHKFSETICYGQKLFLTAKETNDFGVIIRMMDGYYYPIVTGKKWGDDEALAFGSIVLDGLVVDVYPLATHLVDLLDQMLKRERKLLHREPSKQEKLAGIDKLDKFSELTSIKYLQESLKKSREEVMLTPYNECLVEFMLAKEQSQFNERLTKVYQDEAKNKKQ